MKMLQPCSGAVAPSRPEDRGKGATARLFDSHARKHTVGVCPLHRVLTKQPPLARGQWARCAP